MGKKHPKNNIQPLPNNSTGGDVKKFSPKWANCISHNSGGLFLLCAALYGLVVWTFWPSLQGAFLFFDESGYLLRNSHVNQGLTWAGVRWAIFSMDFSNWYPLTWMSHMLDFEWYGKNPWGHHLTNVLLHAANAVLLVLVLKKLTGSLWRSLIVALLFALHPMRVESVAWISERKDVLSIFFWLLAMLAYAWFAATSREKMGKRNLFFALCLAFFTMGLMSKTMLVTFPFVLFLLDYWPLNRWKTEAAWRLVLEKSPFFALIVFIGWIAYQAQQAGGSLSEMASLPLDARFENSLISYVRYLYLSFFPSGLCIYYPHPGYWPVAQVWLSAALLVGVSGAAWRFRLRAPYFFVGWFWYLGTLVPVIGLVQLCSQSIADRYTYVTTIGVAILLVWGLHALTNRLRHQVSTATIAILAVMLTAVILTRHQITFWKDDVTVWTRATEVTKNNYVAHCCLGVVLRPIDSNRAMAEFQNSVTVYGGYAASRRYLAAEMMKRGLIDKAILHYEAAAQIDPLDSDSLTAAGFAHFQRQNIDQAILCLEKSLIRNVNSVPCLTTLSTILIQKNRVEEAIPYLIRAASLEAKKPEPYNNLGVAYLQTGQRAEAADSFRAALRIAPNFTAALKNLADLTAGEQPAPAK